MREDVGNGSDLAVVEVRLDGSSAVSNVPVHSLYSSEFVQDIDVQIKAPSLPHSLAAMIDQVIQF